MGSTYSQAPPTSLVWTPIPCISWLVPFVGHMGITSSNAPYNVSINKMAFGFPTKYYPFTPLNIAIELYRRHNLESSITEHHCLILWDYSVYEASKEYNNYHVHNLFMDNCHSHIALCLNTFQYYLLKYAQGSLDIENLSFSMSMIQDFLNVSNDFNHNLNPNNGTNNQGDKISKWTVPELAIIMFFCGRYISLKGFIYTWMPFISILAFICFFVIYFR